MRRLVAKAGGIESVALIPGISVSNQTVSNWQNPDMSQLPPSLAVTLIEQDVRDPIYSTAMVGLVARAPHDPREPLVRMSEIMKEVGEVAQVVHDAKADGEVDEHERRAICKEGQDVIDVVTALMRDVGCGS